jgi:hypothetical protein
VAIDKTFWTKTALTVELWQQAEHESVDSLLDLFDGAYIMATDVGLSLEPHLGQGPIDIVTSLGTDARLYHPAALQPQVKGRLPRWRTWIAAPQHHLYWPVRWQGSRA